MANAASRKASSYQAIKKNKKKVQGRSMNKENVYKNFRNFYTNQKDDAEYLYIDAKFLKQFSKCNFSRAVAGENFYDCSACDDDKKDYQEMLELMNDIKNVKLFKSLLKQMAFTSNVLYQTFRRAYKKSKIPEYKRKVDDIKGSRDKFSQTKPAEMFPFKHPRLPNHSRERYHDIPDDGKEKFYSKCSCLLREETDVDKENSVMCVRTEITTEDETTKIQNCLIENIVCKNADELNKMNFCGRCAVLRGEIPWPTKESQQNEHQQVIGQLPASVHSVSVTKPLSKQSLNAKPVHITIPLQLQIDGEKLETRFIQAEITMDTGTRAGYGQTNNVPSIIGHKTGMPSTTMYSGNMKEISANDMFQSCSSMSSILKQYELQRRDTENVLNEILEILKGQRPTLISTIEAVMHSQGIQASALVPHAASTAKSSSSKVSQSQSSSSAASQPATEPALTLALAAASASAPSPPASETLLAPITSTSPPPPPPTPEVAPLPTYEMDPRFQARNLRGELLEEVRTALQKDTVLEALQSIKEGHRFSLPKYSKPNAITNVAPARYSAPTTYPATAYQPAAYPPTSYPTTAYQPAAYPATSYPATAYQTTAYPATSYPSTTYQTTAYPATSYPPTSGVASQIPPQLHTGTIAQTNDPVPTYMATSRASAPVSSSMVNRPFAPQQTNVAATRSLGKLPTSDATNRSLTPAITTRANLPVSNKPEISPKPMIVPPPPPSKTKSLVTETIQTDASALKYTAHLKRKSMRHRIQDGLIELLDQDPSNPQTKYKPEERNLILKDLFRLFHPKKPNVPHENTVENAEEDLRYLLQQETPATGNLTSKLSESNYVLKIIKQVVNPKALLKSEKRKYSTETLEKVLTDFAAIIEPTSLHDRALENLSTFLGKAEKSTSSNRPYAAHLDAATSRSDFLRQQRKLRKQEEVRESLMNDLKFMLDSMHQMETNNLRAEQPNDTNAAAAKPIDSKTTMTQNTASKESSNASLKLM